MDLMTMRLRLLDEPAAAGEIAEQLEQAIAQGMSDPLAMRVLGEAYLKLGKVEQAAAMFRQAMLARQRGKG
jgi:Tfp pilus assembly protein PilF